MRAILVILALVLAGWFGVRHLERTRPQDLPWTPLDLAAPPGMATALKLRELAADPATCRAHLSRAGIAFETVPDRATAPGCGFTGAVRVGDVGLPLRPGPVVLSCPAAAALAVWTRHGVIPETRRRLGVRATALINLGTYNCRPIAGSPRLSQHSTANAVDIAAVRTPLGDVRLLADWNAPGPRAPYLRALRDAACRVFPTVLGPDYNAAHADHFHFDMGGWSTCR